MVNSKKKGKRYTRSNGDQFSDPIQNISFLANDALCWNNQTFKITRIKGHHFSAVFSDHNSI